MVANREQIMMHVNFISGYFLRVRESQNVGRELSFEEDRPSVPVASGLLSNVFSPELSRFLGNSSELKLSLSREAVIRKLSSSCRTRARSDSFCCKTS
ncbi:MAG: hypothetical protein DMG71_06795 [Acidobacteria bacterium]|nr:MAG: hypothetical protein DMG71_06795 [Acidobacteriota bacterium]